MSRDITMELLNRELERASTLVAIQQVVRDQSTPLAESLAKIARLLPEDTIMSELARRKGKA